MMATYAKAVFVVSAALSVLCYWNAQRGFGVFLRLKL